MYVNDKSFLSKLFCGSSIMHKRNLAEIKLLLINKSALIVSQGILSQQSRWIWIPKCNRMQTTPFSGRKSIFNKSP